MTVQFSFNDSIFTCNYPIERNAFLNWELRSSEFSFKWLEMIEVSKNHQTCLMETEWAVFEARGQRAENEGRSKNREETRGEAITSKWTDRQRERLDGSRDEKAGTEDEGAKDPQSFPPVTIKYLTGGIRDHIEMISLSLSLTSAGIWEVH